MNFAEAYLVTNTNNNIYLKLIEKHISEIYTPSILWDKNVFSQFIKELTLKCNYSKIPINITRDCIYEIYPNIINTELAVDFEKALLSKPSLSNQDIVRTVIENNVSEQYQELNKLIEDNKKIFISSVTGSGKSYYIFKYLIPHIKSLEAGNKHIICCATPLKMLTIQQKNYLDNTNMSYEIVCEGYMSAKKINDFVLSETEIIQTTFESMKEVYYKCVENGYKITFIMDEVHQLITSASYMNLGLMNNIISYSNRVIGLSGTIDGLYHSFFKNDYKMVVINSLTKKSEQIDYSILSSPKVIVNEICNSITKRDKTKKLLIFLNDIKKIEKCYQFCVDNGIKASRVHRSLSKLEIEENKSMRNIFENEMIDDNLDVLFSTSILDTGINIKNENIEVWYVSTFCDNDVIRFEQSIARYRKKDKKIKLFLITQKRESMYGKLLALGANALGNKEILKYYKDNLLYIGNCVNNGYLDFIFLKPEYYLVNDAELESITTYANNEIYKFNELVNLKKKLSINETTKLEFVRGSEYDELNDILDVVYKDNTEFYFLNKFKLYNNFRIKEVKSITNEKFIEMISIEDRTVTFKEDLMSNDNDEAIKKSVEKYEKNEAYYKNIMINTLKLKADTDVDEAKKKQMYMLWVMVELSTDDMKKNITEFTLLIERKYDININNNNTDYYKYRDSEDYNPLYKQFYKDSVFLLKSVMKLTNILKRFFLKDLVHYVNISEICDIVVKNDKPHKFNELYKKTNLLLNQKIYKIYSTYNYSSLDVSEYQTKYYKNLISGFTVGLGKYVTMDKLRTIVNELPKIESINTSKYKEGNYVKLIKNFFNISSKRVRDEKNKKKFNTVIKIDSLIKLEDIFSENTVAKIETGLVNYYANHITNEIQNFL